MIPTHTNTAHNIISRWPIQIPDLIHTNAYIGINASGSICIDICVIPMPEPVPILVPISDHQTWTSFPCLLFKSEFQALGKGSKIKLIISAEFSAKGVPPPHPPFAENN